MCSSGSWEFQSSLEVCVPLEFLDKSGDGGFLHHLQDYTVRRGIPVATLTDLTVCKGIAWLDRDERKDFKGLSYIATKMANEGMDFSNVGDDGKELLLEY